MSPLPRTLTSLSVLETASGSVVAENVGCGLTTMVSVEDGITVGAGTAESPPSDAVTVSEVPAVTAVGLPLSAHTPGDGVTIKPLV